MQSIYVIGGKKFNNYKVVCRMHTWVVCAVVVETLLPIVKQCILNQT
jgi:hypothetical protein